MHKTDAIILKRFQYNDKQSIIHTYTYEYGFMEFITPNSTQRKKWGVSPMQIVEIEFFLNQKGKINSIKNIYSVGTNTAIFAVPNINILMLWAEILSVVLKKEEANPDIFDYIKNAIEYINEDSNNAQLLNLFFLYNFLKFIGFKIDTSTFQSGYLFSVEDGCFYSESSANKTISGINAAKIIFRLSTCKVQDIDKVKLNKSSMKILLDILLIYIDRHLNTKLYNNKGIKIIYEVFN